MSFLYPYFLFASLAIAIPIVIHLFNFRRFKVVYFSNTAFLKNIQQQTKSQSKFKHLLILLSRILTILALVFAFAQPFIPISGKKANVNVKNVGIYVDNSFSMDAESKNGKLLDVAKTKAKELAKSYNSTTKFLLTTNDFDAKHQHFLNRDQLFEYIDELSLSSNVKSTSEIIQHQKEFFKNEGFYSLYFLSDFQKSTSNIDKIIADTTFSISLLPLNNQPTNNLFIDSCWFEKPNHRLNEQDEIFVKIKNNSEESYTNIPIKLFLNDSLKGLSSVNLQPKSDITISIAFTNSYKGLNSGKIELTDYPIIYDNQMFFSYNILNQYKVLAINEKNENLYLNSIFANDADFEFSNKSVSQINYAEFSTYNTIVLNEIKSFSSGLSLELNKFCKNGGSILILPAMKADLESYNQFLTSLNSGNILSLDSTKTNLKQINKQSEMYKNAIKKIAENPEMPSIFKHYILQRKTNSIGEILLQSQNEHNILIKNSFGKGKVYLSAIAFNKTSSNFMTNPVFVPTILNIVLQSQVNNKLYYTIGNENVIEMNNLNSTESNLIHISDKAKKFDFIPEVQMNNATSKIILHNNITLANNYFMTNNTEDIDILSFNYNRKESDLKYFNSEELEEIISSKNITNLNILNINNDIRQSLSDLNQGIKLWKWFILLALIFIAAEIALIKWL